MRIFGFTPAFWPTAISFPCLLVALALGTWQVQRLEWKQALIAERTAQLAAAPIPLPARPMPGDPALDFHPVRVSGQFLSGEVHLAARSLRGNTGYDVIVPLRRDDGSVVLVDRGWVPPELKPAAKRANEQASGEVTIDGIARTRYRKGYFQPDNDVAKNVWFWIDFVAMGKALGVEPLPLIVEAGAGATPPSGFPKGGQTRVDLVNNHLSYVVTWYSVAVTIVVIYLVWHRQRAKAEAKG